MPQHPTLQLSDNMPGPRPEPHPGVAPALLGAVAGFLLLSAWIFAPGWERAFRSDNSPASWLSSALLLTLCITALRLTAERCLPWRLGVWLVLAFGTLALDEQFMLHELWKFRCHEWTDACRWGLVREAPMLTVAVVGLATLAWLHRALSHRSTRCLLWAGCAVGLAAIAVDQWPEVQSHLSWLPELPELLATLEEALEVTAEALVLGALLRQPVQR
ncbi:hypothetical protein ASE52_18045 [Acidovorax sp. Root275]|uniref:hypothetical protein n=1 Tax=Acidovorax sp. Root275 TaxID=1736508 RepID=UPI00070FF438|nr:hypothetical protein [Acidovorax sp. Root275]KRD46546.1 hypothetical protein ASE52_18045 [Acidovorax sp. Root275]